MNPEFTQDSALQGETPPAVLAAGGGGGSKGAASSSPSTAVSGVPGNVAGPLTGDLDPGKTGIKGEEALAASKPKKARKLRSDKRKLKLSFSPTLAERLQRIPQGTRSQTVEIAVLLFLEGRSADSLEKALPELCDLSIRLQQILQYLTRSKTIAPQKRIKLKRMDRQLLCKFLAFYNHENNRKSMQARPW